MYETWWDMNENRSMCNFFVWKLVFGFAFIFLINLFFSVTEKNCSSCTSLLCFLGVLHHHNTNAMEHSINSQYSFRATERHVVIILLKTCPSYTSYFTLRDSTHDPACPLYSPDHVALLAMAMAVYFIPPPLYFFFFSVLQCSNHSCYLWWSHNRK